MASLEFFLSSHLAASAALAAGALVLYALLRREVRVRPHAAWTAETVIGVVFAPLITILVFGAIVLGTLSMQGWGAQPPSMLELATAAGAGMFAALVWILASPRTAPGSTGRRGETGARTTATAASG